MNENDVLEALNETDLIVNSTTNQSIFQINDIKDVHNILLFLQEKLSDMLISWNMVPEDLYFKSTLFLIAMVILFWLFVYGSSKIGGLFKFVLMAFFVILILIILEII